MNRQSCGVCVCAFALCAGLALAGGALVTPHWLLGQAEVSKAKKPKSRVPNWDPPQVNSRLNSRLAEPPCVLPDALKQAAASANAQFDHLKGFTAREDIQFQMLDLLGVPRNDSSRSYDYRVLLRQTPGGLVLQDSRDSRGGSKLQVPFDQDLGLPELALIFLPGMQADYDFNCEGTAQWKGQAAFVIRFQQRKDKPQRTVSFRGEDGAYPASVRGRAWIATESGEIQHLETSLMKPISGVNVHNWYLSIDYAPIVFPPKNVRMILPQTVDAYCEFPGMRTIAYHTFSEFQLFRVDVSIKPAPDH